MKQCHREGVRSQEFRSLGVQEFRSSGVRSANPLFSKDFAISN
ncbi:hypothetical protein [Dolichospermum sp. UHCC 0259]|nr:hypothetical protein [Dolichospermum sp. UHCC 0259]